MRNRYRHTPETGGIAVKLKVRDPRRRRPHLVHICLANVCRCRDGNVPPSQQAGAPTETLATGTSCNRLLPDYEIAAYTVDVCKRKRPSVGGFVAAENAQTRLRWTSGSTPTTRGLKPHLMSTIRLRGQRSCRVESHELSRRVFLLKTSEHPRSGASFCKLNSVRRQFIVWQ